MEPRVSKELDCVSNLRVLAEIMKIANIHLMFFTEDGVVGVKHWPEQLIEQMREFERKKGTFRRLNSWKMLIDMLLERVAE